MGTVSVRKSKDGKVRFRAEIRRAVHGYPKFSESKTFSKRSLAEAWLRKREAEIEADPDIMRGRKSRLLFGEAIVRFLTEAGDNYARTVNKSLSSLQRMEVVASLDITAFSRADIAHFAHLRRKGCNGFKPVTGSTVLHDLRLLRMVLNQAELSWGYAPPLHEFDRAVEGLRKGRVVHASREREALPSPDDLRRLSLLFFRDWLAGKTVMPMHLIMWLAIYSTRREAELSRLDLRDFNRTEMSWLVRDVKSPYGSAGNHKAFVVLPQVVPLVDLLLSSPYRARMPKSEHLLLPLNPRSVANRFRKARDALGINGDICFHSLRHEGITRLAEDGWSVPQMQTVSLHGSWSSLQRYADHRRKRERLDWVDIAHECSLA